MASWNPNVVRVNDIFIIHGKMIRDFIEATENVGVQHKFSSFFRSYEQEFQLLEPRLRNFAWYPVVGETEQNALFFCNHFIEICNEVKRMKKLIDITERNRAFLEMFRIAWHGSKNSWMTFLMAYKDVFDLVISQCHKYDVLDIRIHFGNRMYSSVVDACSDWMKQPTHENKGSIRTAFESLCPSLRRPEYEAWTMVPHQQDVERERLKKEEEEKEKKLKEEEAENDRKMNDLLKIMGRNQESAQANYESYSIEEQRRSNEFEKNVHRNKIDGILNSNEMFKFETHAIILKALNCSVAIVNGWVKTCDKKIKSIEIQESVRPADRNHVKDLVYDILKELEDTQIMFRKVRDKLQLMENYSGDVFISTLRRSITEILELCGQCHLKLNGFKDLPQRLLGGSDWSIIKTDLEKFGNPELVPTMEKIQNLAYNSTLYRDTYEYNESNESYIVEEVE